MFRQMRRREKLMTPEETAAVLHNAEYGTLATISDDGYPYSVPLNFTFDGNAVYFHSARRGHKLDNIGGNSQVSFSAVNYSKVIPENFDTEYDSAVIFGRAEEVRDETEKRAALLALIKKYSGSYLEKGLIYIDKSMKAAAVYKINIEHVTGKKGR